MTGCRKKNRNDNIAYKCCEKYFKHKNYYKFWNVL